LQALIEGQALPVQLRVVSVGQRGQQGRESQSNQILLVLAQAVEPRLPDAGDNLRYRQRHLMVEG
jgi:hypothetical protein